MIKTKKVEVKKKEINVPQLKSIIGEKQYNKELKEQILSGIPITEAPELIARRLAKQNPQ